MAEENAEQRAKDLAVAFADGLDIFEARQAERNAKAKAEADRAGGNGGDAGNGDKEPKRSLAEWILGQ